MLPNKLGILVVGKLIQEQFKILVLSVLAQAVDVRCIVRISSGKPAVLIYVSHCFHH